MNRENLKAVFNLLIFVMISATLGAAYFYMTVQQTKIRASGEKIEVLNKEKIMLKTDIEKFKKRERAVVYQNRDLRTQSKQFDEQKKLIIDQVRTSVAGFETFRKNALDEIAGLKESVSSLETEKKEAEEKLGSLKSLSESDKERLTGEVATLNTKIEQLKLTESQLVENLNQKNKFSIVSETSKLHYNLGNFYFRNNDYANAAAEYKKALFYKADDVDANFNLAVVSDDFLDDRATALFRYKRYLELCPRAHDYNKIKQKVFDLEMQSKVLDEAPKPIERGVFNDKKEGDIKLNFLKDKS